MKTTTLIVISLFFISLAGCVATPPKLTVNTGTAEPGGMVARKGEPLKLLGTPLRIGEDLPRTQLVDANTMEEVDLASTRGKVLFLSIVPSIDTKVCEAQTHYLGEEGDILPGMVERITISRDTPFAQKRFAEEAGLADIRYLSDYKNGGFGKATGLLVEGSELLARAVILVDKEGKAQYIQVVPELTDLPDMERAFRQAAELTRK